MRELNKKIPTADYKEICCEKCMSTIACLCQSCTEYLSRHLTNDYVRALKKINNCSDCIGTNKIAIPLIEIL